MNFSYINYIIKIILKNSWIIKPYSFYYKYDGYYKKYN